MPTSPETLLCVVRALPPPAEVRPCVLSVGAGAHWRVRTYGTILVDLERQRVVDLLPDRTAETRARWLMNHSGVESSAGPGNQLR